MTESNPNDTLAEEAAEAGPMESARSVPGAPGARSPDAQSAAGAERTPEEIEEETAEEELDDELDHLQRELSGLNDRHLRLAAEFENYRRRAQGEMAETWVRAQADLVRRLLDGLDDLQRVTAMDSDDTEDVILEGVRLVERKLLKSLEEAGVETLNPVDEPFDPQVMEAVLRVPVDDEDQEDRVQDVFQKGYSLKGHLIRPARVTVRTSA